MELTRTNVLDKIRVAIQSNILEHEHQKFMRTYSLLDCMTDEEFDEQLAALPQEKREEAFRLSGLLREPVSDG